MANEIKMRDRAVYTGPGRPNLFFDETNRGWFVVSGWPKAFDWITKDALELLPNQPGTHKIGEPLNSQLEIRKHRSGKDVHRILAHRDDPPLDEND